MTISPATAPLLVSASTFLVVILLFVGVHQVNRQRSTRRAMLEKVRIATSEEEAFLAQTSAPSSGGSRSRVSDILNSIG